MRVQKTVNILGKFKGKIRLVAKRLSSIEFHDRSKPVAIAARCAKNQVNIGIERLALFE